VIRRRAGTERPAPASRNARAKCSARSWADAAHALADTPLRDRADGLQCQLAEACTTTTKETRRYIGDPSAKAFDRATHPYRAFAHPSARRGPLRSRARLSASTWASSPPKRMGLHCRARVTSKGHRPWLAPALTPGAIPPVMGDRSAPAHGWLRIWVDNAVALTNTRGGASRCFGR
jgi:hypothetical protein